MKTFKQYTDLLGEGRVTTKPIGNGFHDVEENEKPRTAKALIYQTDVYGAKGYFGQCKEPGCDHKTKTYDRIAQAQKAIKKHHQKHFKMLDEGRVTTKPVGNGFHRVFIDGKEHPHVQIVNGSGGVSGYGRNVYGVRYSQANKTRWIGSLAKTKEHLNRLLSEGPLSPIPAEKGLKRNFFHGNYGGFGNRGGEPVDKLDKEFQKHDVGYHHSKKPRDIKKHDKALVKSTRKLIGDKSLPLSTRAKAGMAHAYFRTKLALNKKFHENFMDGRNPQDKGDMSRHGLKGKSIQQLKKVRSSDTASPRQKQLAHWYINMHSKK